MQSLKADGTLQKLFVKYSVSYQKPTLVRSK